MQTAHLSTENHLREGPLVTVVAAQLPIVVTGVGVGAAGGERGARRGSTPYGSIPVAKGHRIKAMCGSLVPQSAENHAVIFMA